MLNLAATTAETYGQPVHLIMTTQPERFVAVSRSFCCMFCLEQLCGTNSRMCEVELQQNAFRYLKFLFLRINVCSEILQFFFSGAVVAVLTCNA